jgi:CDGSH-type Zn-finger protein/uncharacterized Fe-S cluster protein YjdI
MAKKVHRYEGERITVRYDSQRCIHAEECIHGLAGVFDPEKRPWIQPDEAGADEVAAVILRCPTGALTFERQDEGVEEAVPDRNKIRVAVDGPLYVQGDVEIASADGTALTRESRAALCRCGGSANKPFCDNRHREIAFQDLGRVEACRLGETPDSEAPRRLHITVVANGPLLLRGPVELGSADGAATHRGSKGALCRCGASASKPYCDGSHVAIGFEAD